VAEGREGRHQQDQKKKCRQEGLKGEAKLGNLPFAFRRAPRLWIRNLRNHIRSRKVKVKLYGIDKDGLLFDMMSSYGAKMIFASGCCDEGDVEKGNR